MLAAVSLNGDDNWEESTENWARSGDGEARDDSKDTLLCAALPGKLAASGLSL